MLHKEKFDYEILLSNFLKIPDANFSDFPTEDKDDFYLFMRLLICDSEKSIEDISEQKIIELLQISNKLIDYINTDDILSNGSLEKRLNRIKSCSFRRRVL